MLVTLPSWPDIFLPGNTRPGSCAIEIEPGTLCERLLPCDARCDLKWWRLIVPVKPLPIDVPCTSTSWPTAKTPTGTCAPGLYSAATVVGDAEFLHQLAGDDAGLGQVARLRAC